MTPPFRRAALSLLAVVVPSFMAGLACKTESAKPAPVDRPPVAARPVTSADNAARVSTFGSAIRPGGEVALADVLGNPRAYEGKTVTVDGEVRRVCKKMGCWMELATAMNDQAPGCRVFFGAHQFFVPKDSDGSRARVQGEVQVKQVQADFVEHLEQEGASFKAKNHDGTADEVRLVATGVELKRI